MQSKQRSFISDRRTFSSYERKLITDYVSFLSEVWDQELTKAHGMTDEGESWVVISQDTPEGVNTISAISIEINSNDKFYRYFCGVRQKDFMVCCGTLIEVIEHQAQDGVFEQFMLHHNTAPDTEDSANVIQLIPTS